MYNDLLAKKLKALRKAHNLNQDDVAAELGIARQTYSHYENANRTPSADALAKLANLYGISTAELLSLAVLGISPEEYKNEEEALAGQNTDSFLEYTQRPSNQQKLAVLSSYEKELLFYFEKLSKDDKEEIIELAKFKNRRRQRGTLR